jgi:hypothetical protein
MRPVCLAVPLFQPEQLLQIQQTALVIMPNRLAPQLRQLVTVTGMCMPCQPADHVKIILCPKEI